MTAMLLAIGTFAVWTLVGLGLLVSLGVETRSLALLLTAPVLGACLVTMIAFGFSRAGLAVEDFAALETGALLIASLGVLAWRLPNLPWNTALPVIAALAGMVLAGSPMLDLGFRWIANANDDMANYVLAAERLFRHGFSAPVDIDQFVAGRDYTVAAQALQAAGARPGSQLLLAWQEGVSGQSAQQAFMPLIIALHGCSLCAVAALAAHASRRRVVAGLLAIVLLAVAPLATFGVVQQLLAQEFGLAVGAALVAVLLRPELHKGEATLAEKALLGFLTASLALAYVEIGVIFFIAYVAFLTVLATRRQIRLRAVASLWGPAMIVALLLLNTYVVAEARYLGGQAHAGGSSSGDPPLFGFIFVPSALPAVLGLRRLPFEGFIHLSLWIAFAFALFALILVATVLTLRRSQGSGFVLLASAGIAIGLVLSSADFGLFKLAMYVQPFIAATAAIAIVDMHRRSLQLGGAVLLLVWLAAAIPTQREYINQSRDPIELRHGSSAAVFPAFREIIRSTSGPVVSVTANPVLAKLESSTTVGHPLFFLGREMFGPLMEELSRDIEGGTFKAQARLAVRLSHWKRQVFVIPSTRGNEGRMNPFDQNQFAIASLRKRGCTLVVGTGSQVALNRRLLPEGMPDLIAKPCASMQNVLVFVSSKLGENYYLPTDRKRISLYQLEDDVYFSDNTFSAAGRYALLQVLHPTGAIRLCLDFTKTLARDGANILPPATVAGESRARIPTVGRGSARLCSRPVTPQVIDGEAYVMLDMGADGRFPVIPRPGLLALYGENFPIDPRYLTSYVRDISLISETDYAKLRAPNALRSFPADLENSDLEYSGIYEDGWVAEKSYALLAPGAAEGLLVEGDAFGMKRRLVVLLDGQVLARKRVGAGPFRIGVRAPASQRRRRVELRFSSVTVLPDPDGRPISARLTFLGFAGR